MFGFGGASERQKDFSEPIWEWPTLKDRPQMTPHAGSEPEATGEPGRTERTAT